MSRFFKFRSCHMFVDRYRERSSLKSRMTNNKKKKRYGLLFFTFERIIEFTCTRNGLPRTVSAIKRKRERIREGRARLGAGLLHPWTSLTYFISATVIVSLVFPRKNRASLLPSNSHRFSLYSKRSLPAFLFLFYPFRSYSPTKPLSNVLPSIAIR